MYAKQLRTAVKSAEGQNKTINSLPSDLQELLAEDRKKRNKNIEELPGVERSVQLVGGDYEEMASFTLIDCSMPVGAYTVISGQVFKLKEDGKLHYCEEQTEKLLSKKREI